MENNKIRNLELKDFPGFIIEKANNYQMARAALKINQSCNVPNVKLTEYVDGELTKYAFTKRHIKK